ncbi:histidine phosphatase family protein [Phytoactinopolyspora halotolerans]|uniref:Histidine phosphatase family protein n=1 Tax=Phytoactinopolyspora halotolerans TaxID=1981512 RepID=A0A6L9SA74_9ACTN|nr:histidine phosphatase family protein [Phytoactinopolyspora halotolerans]NEE00860.1 histidine phosphatase family protein [Phytoactinopolyspora halotolerans]
MGELIVVRHGETEWSRDRRHTGRTDLPLTAHGEEQARLLGPLLSEYSVAHTLVSPAIRAWRTGQLAGLDGAEADEDLWEWDYGGYEGRATADIREERPGWYLWTDGVIPGDAEHPGESVEQVGARVDAVLKRARPLLDDGDVVLVAHGHVLRVLTARWLGLEPAAGRLFKLETGTVSLLGTEHGHPVISAWNTRDAGRRAD